ncbi:Gfo/Idh/MocA family oxidoreductase [uncultured Acidaminococcus sp.]|uniref:Gfo/Idh/MocA family protein n=1 Tax=uncultured Acidaminococcus sp. TaxID=352152 RepID=UPI0027DCE0A3|nr:Gfo/Idh/MocA family oxidoreductase [uncultured Acidaminococcus sp.]
MDVGVLGSGAIVPVALASMEAVPGIRVKALWCREHSRQRGEALAREYGISQVFTDLESLFREGGVDTVYIALVNPVHYAYARAALLAGKNVILEKPFCPSFAQAQDLAELARRQGLFLLEAMPLWHGALFRKVRELVPRLGPIRVVQCNYSQYSSRYDRYLQKEVLPAFDPAAFGGALYDLDVYNIAFAAGLFGRPEKVAYAPNRGWNGVDTSGVLFLQYPGFQAVLTAAKDSNSPSFLQIQGEKGWLKAEGKPIHPHRMVWKFVQGPDRDQFSTGAGKKEESVQSWTPPERKNRMVEEFGDYARIVNGKKKAEAEAYLQMTLTASEVLERAAHSFQVYVSTSSR